jgi:hypothetical protein
VAGCGVGCAIGDVIGGCAGDEAIGCCGGFIIGFIDAGNFVVVGLILWQCLSNSRRSRKSPRFPYILNLLFRCRLERRERCRLERPLSLLYASWFFVTFRVRFLCEKKKKKTSFDGSLMDLLSQYSRLIA